MFHEVALFFMWYSCLSMSIDGMCVDPLAPTVNTVNGHIVHPLFLMSLISGVYLSILC